MVTIYCDYFFRYLAFPNLLTNILILTKNISKITVQHIMQFYGFCKIRSFSSHPLYHSKRKKTWVTNIYTVSIKYCIIPIKFKSLIFEQNPETRLSLFLISGLLRVFVIVQVTFHKSSDSIDLFCKWQYIFLTSYLVVFP